MRVLARAAPLIMHLIPPLPPLYCGGLRSLRARSPFRRGRALESFQVRPATLTPSNFAGAGGGSELAVVLSRLEALDVKTEALKSGQEALAGSVKLIAYASTHATSERSDTLIKGKAAPCST